MEPRKSDESYTTSTANATPKSLPLYRDRPSLQVMAAFFALNLSIFLVALDTVLIPTALPTISQSFHIPDSLYAWTGSAYLLANAASIPFWGALSDVFGRKPVILFANGIFLFGSIICAVSVSASILIAGRAVQGLGGGGVVVLVYVCVSDLFSIRDRSFYIGIVGAMWAFASALGPVLGGIFADSVGWRWCFYINLPIISFSIVVLCFSLHLHNPRTPLLTGLASMDWLGTLTILTATILLLVGLQIGGTTSYTRPAVIIFLIFGSLTYMAFPFSQLWVEKRDGSPITPLRIFNDVSNLSALGVCACDALVFNSVAYFLPLYFQIVLGRSPTTTGVYMLAIAIPLATICFASGHFINKTGRFMDVLQVGLFLMTLGVGLLIALDTRLDLGKIIGTLIVIGLGFGPNFGAPLIALQTRVQKSDIATGTAAFGFVRMVSGTVGLVIGQVVFQALMKPHFQVFVDCGIEEGFARELTSGDAISQIATVARLPEAQRMVIREEFVGALRGTWILYTVIGAVGLLVSFGIKRTKLHQESMCLADIEMIRDDGSARSSS
ncbi:MFS general substrate transporter [Clathrospora elynae]|uniref:MFS general substrate transporter n=1 Tax=Clathrospora elynae TaxID=706981 RepID=A0A6A5S5I3_9PLEO|nr:MFS general substrate transporter [Clathrospora elynae]